MAIEKFFGQLRSQYANSELTARGYWNALARVMRKLSKDSSKQEVSRVAVEEPPLSATEIPGHA